MIRFRTPGKSLTLPDLIKTFLFLSRPFVSSPITFAMISLPVERRTLVTCLFAEFGFLGYNLYNLRTRPFN